MKGIKSPHKKEGRERKETPSYISRLSSSISRFLSRIQEERDFKKWERKTKEAIKKEDSFFDLGNETPEDTNRRRESELKQRMKDGVPPIPFPNYMQCNPYL